MQNNRRDEFKEQTPNYQGRRHVNLPAKPQSILPAKTQSNAPRSSSNVYPPRTTGQNAFVKRVYPNPKPALPNPNYRPQKEQRRAPVYESAKTRISRVYPDRPRQTSNSERPKTPLIKRRKPSKLVDFLLGLTIGFIVFGTAAVFVVRTVIEIFI